MRSIYEGERIVSFSDLKRLFSDLTPLLKKWGGLAFCLSFLFSLFLEPSFQVKASFKTASAIPDKASVYKDLLTTGALSQKESTPLVILKSDTILEKTVKREGLQVKCAQDTAFFLRPIRNVLWAFGVKPQDREIFRFEKIDYPGERKQKYTLKITSSKTADLLGKKGEFLTSIEVNTPFVTDTFKGILTHIPPSFVGKKISLSLIPLEKVTEKLRTHLLIKENKIDPSVLTLKMKGTHRYLTADLLNAVLSSYEEYLKEQNSKKVELQLAYLQQREAQLTEEWDRALQSYADYLHENLSSSGYLDCAEEIKVLASSKNHFTSKLFEVDLELKRLKSKGGSDTSFTPPLGALNSEGIESVYQEYQGQKNRLELSLVKQTSLLKKLKDNDLDISALSTILTDPVAQEMVHLAAGLVLQLKDQENRSFKERVQLTESLEVQKKFLIDHLQQSISLEQLQLSLVHEKIEALQESMRGLLSQEKHLIKHKIDEIAEEMTHVPERLRRENLLSLKKETGLRLLETIAQLVEARNMDLHLFQATAHSLDLAKPPLKPLASPLFRNSLFMALFVCFVLYFYHFIQRLSKGFPLTHETLLLSGFESIQGLSPKCGTPLETLSQKDLAILRQLSSRICEKQIHSTVILGKNSPNFSSPLAELLGLQGYKVLVIDALIQTPSQEAGLLHYLEDKMETTAFQKKKGYDYLPSGGSSPYFQELLSTQRYHLFFQEMKQRYDKILIYTEVEIASVNTLGSLAKEDLLIATLSSEIKENLLALARSKEDPFEHLICLPVRSQRHDVL